MSQSPRKPDLPPRSAHFFAPLQVLVVDDMPAIRAMLRQMLQALGVRRQIDESADGLQAWRALQAISYDLVICDINMPHMNGLELLRRLRADPRYETTPFLMITGEVTEDIVAAAAESEVDGYLLKPFRINALESRLRTIILNRHQPGAAAPFSLKAAGVIPPNRGREALTLLKKFLASLVKNRPNS